MQSKNKKLLFLILIFLGCLTRFLFIWHPNQVVFDEVHFGKFVSAYYSGEYYFDIHPPLGKILIAGFAKFFGFKPGFDFDRIGKEYGEIPYISLRFLPNLAGALIPAMAFLWLMELGVGWKSSFLASLFLVFDNAMLVQSHFLLVDSFLIFFGLFGLWLFLRARNLGYSIRDLILAALFFGMSFSVKWTGLSFFALATFIIFWDLMLWGIEQSKSRILLKQFSSATSRFLGKGLLESAVSFRYGTLRNFLGFILFIAIAVLVYLLVFWIHFMILPKSGPGNIFMSSNFFQKSFFEKVIELNLVMFNANQNLRASHSYGSPAWTWPFMLRPVYYWVGDALDGKSARIYLFGNPVVWWLSTLGLILALFWWSPKKVEQKLILYFGWILNMAPFFFVKRVMFLYHYLPALVFASAIFCSWIFASGKIEKKQKLFGILIIAMVFLSFLFFAPLSYGLALSDQQYKMRIWLPSWR